jgi:hypothetical protein
MKEILEAKKATLHIQLSGKNKRIYKKAVHALQIALHKKQITTKFYDEKIINLNNYFLFKKEYPETNVSFNLSK